MTVDKVSHVYLAFCKISNRLMHLSLPTTLSVVWLSVSYPNIRFKDSTVQVSKFSHHLPQNPYFCKYLDNAQKSLSEESA